MNPRLQAFARQTLKEDLAKCNEGQQHKFKLMYANDNMDMDINDIVDQMHESKLDWAMQQVENSLTKNATKKPIIINR